MNNLDQVDNQQCNIYEPYLSSLPCLYRNHALLKTAHLTVNVIGIKVKASRRVSYPVLKLLIRENTLVLPLRLNMAFTAA